MRMFRLDTRTFDEFAKLFPAETIGTLLRNFRDDAHLSQRDIAKRLKCNNICSMSQVEKDRIKIPAHRFIDFMNAYEVPHEARLKLFARCYSAHWEALKQLT
jgi:transcriptional regulator with XRE-family HTH domain